MDKSIRPEVITKDDILDAMIARSARMSGKKDMLSRKEASELLKIFEEMKR